MSDRPVHDSDCAIFSEPAERNGPCDCSVSKKHQPPIKHVDIVFSGFPGIQAPSFIEVENEKCESVSFGEWIKRPDGQSVLRINLSRKDI